MPASAGMTSLRKRRGFPPFFFRREKAKKRYTVAMKILIAILAVMLLLLQISLWLGDGSLPKAWQLQQAVNLQKTENEKLAERNRALKAEVDDLKQGQAAIEERARNELGMIRQGETFYQVIEE